MRHVPIYLDKLCAFERWAPSSDDEPIFVDKKSYEAMPADMDNCSDPTGAVLVLLEHPTKAEQKNGATATSKANLWIRELFSKAKVPVVYYHVLPAIGANEKEKEAARGHVHALYKAVKPCRILAMGREPIFVATGSSVEPNEVPDGYHYTSEGTPILFCDSPVFPYNHRLRKPKFEKSFKQLLEYMPPLPPWEGKAMVIESLADSKAALDDLRQHPWVAYDTETAGTPRPTMWFRRGCLAICAPGSDDAYVWDWKHLQKPHIQANLRGFFGDPEVKLCAHNIKFDLQAESHALGMVGDNDILKITEDRIYADTMLWSFLLDSEYKHGLEAAACRVGMGGHKKEMKEALDGAIYLTKKYNDLYKSTGVLPDVLSSPHWEVLQRAAMDPDFQPKRWAYLLVPNETMIRYCALDTVSCARLCSHLEEPVLSDECYSLVWEKRLRPGSWALAQAEYWGMPFSVDKITNASRGFKMAVENCEKELLDFGCTRDVSKPAELGAYLYEDLGLPVVAQTDKGKPKTDKATLDELYRRTSNPVLSIIKKLSEARKLYTTYGLGLAAKGSTGRIYGSFWLHGARSGRLSSSNPNLQNLPSRGKLGKAVKRSFSPGPGRTVVDCDISALEYRVTAAIANDPVMLGIFERGEDLHMSTAKSMAKTVWGIQPEECTKEHRTMSKTVSFGTLYGKAAFSLAEDLGISEAKATQIQEGLMGSWSKVAKDIADKRKTATKFGKTQTYIDVDGELRLARTRQLPAIGSTDQKAEGSELRSAHNSSVQGSGSDICLGMVIGIVKWIVESGVDAKLVATVHDSIIVECADEVAVAVHNKVLEFMTTKFGPVEITSDGGLGPDYGTQYELKDLQALKAAGDQSFSKDEKLKVIGWDGEEETKSDLEVLLENMECYMRRVL